MAGYENKKEKNTHTFWKDGAKVVFLPLLEGVISVTRQTNGMQAENLLTRRKFETELGKQGQGTVLKTRDPISKGHSYTFQG